MLRTIAVLFFFCLASVAAYGQNYNAVAKALQKQDFDKAWAKLQKLFEKDAEDPAASYFASVYFWHPSRPGPANLDTAWHFVNRAIERFPPDDEKQLKKLQKADVTGRTLATHKERVGTDAWKRADSTASEQAYDYFATRFASASQVPQAKTLRDSLAFLQASNKDTWQAYQQFFKKYPGAEQAITARKRYHQLLYTENTSRKSLQDYETFIAKYPNSPMRKQAEENLYNLYTAEHLPATYRTFLDKYADSHFADRARSWLWFLSEDKQRLQENYPKYTEEPYVQAHMRADTATFIGYFDKEEKSYGFMDLNGSELISPRFEALPPEFICAPVKSSFLKIIDNDLEGAVDFNGRLIVEARFEKVEGFAPGVLLVKAPGGYGLVQQSGFTLVEPVYEELQYLTPQLVKARKNGKWGIITYNGKKLLDFAYSHIASENGNVIEIEQGGLYAYETNASLLKRLVQPEKIIQFIYSDHEISHEDFMILVYNNIYRLRNIERDRLLLDGASEIQESHDGWVVRKDGKYTIYRLTGRKVSPVDYEEVIAGQKAYAVKISGKWGVINFDGQLFIQPLYDTLYFVGDRGILLEKEDRKLGYFYQEELTDFSDYASLNIQSAIIHTDSSSQELPFIITTDQRGRKGLLSGKGKMLVKNLYQNLVLTRNGLVILERNGKKGLADLQGNILLPARYTGIQDMENGTYSVLQGKNFGLFFADSGQIIAPDYTALVKSYGTADSLLVAKKEKFGIIDLNGKPVTGFKFDKVNFWSDTVALVQDEEKWKLYNFASNYYLQESFDDFEYLKKNDGEIVIKTYRSSGYGVLSSQYGRIIPEEYSNIVNLGSGGQPLYLVERDVAQAGLHILLYIDKKGVVLRQQVLNEAEYQHMNCLD